MKAKKYTYIKVIQQNYNGNGWDDCSEYSNAAGYSPLSQLKHDLHEYRLSVQGQPISTRVIERRELNTLKSL